MNRKILFDIVPTKGHIHATLKKATLLKQAGRRIQLARHADFIYVIENKQVVSLGTHDEIAQTSRLYWEAFEDIILVKDKVLG